jgi:hypothetical protein
MSIEIARHALLWCAVLNYALLLVWFLLSILAHDWLHRFWGRSFRLSTETFDTVSFTGIVLYKTGIILFNIVPCVALYIVG